jgi:hypothetical protein
MRCASLFIAFVLLEPQVAAAAAKPPLTAHERLALMAPADAYFGAFGMSPLSIRSMIGFLGRQYHYRTISDRDLLRKALVTEDALRKWRANYPGDPWLAPTFYHLEQLYQAVQTEEARKHARAILNDVVRYYPDTRQAHLSRMRLAQGFPALEPEAPLNLPATASAAAPAPAPSTESSAAPEPAGTASPQAAATAPRAAATESQATGLARPRPSPN